MEDEKPEKKSEGEDNDTWYLSGRYNPDLPGGGGRHPLEYD